MVSAVSAAGEGRGVGVEACLLANIEFAGAHFGQNSVVWGMKIADFGAIWSPVTRAIVAILGKTRFMRIGCA